MVFADLLLGDEEDRKRSRDGDDDRQDDPRRKAVRTEDGGDSCAHRSGEEKSGSERSYDRSRVEPGFDRSSADPKVLDGAPADCYGTARERSSDAPGIERTLGERPRDHSVSSVMSDRGPDSHSSGRQSSYQEGSRAGYTAHGRGGHHQTPSSSRRVEGGSLKGQNIQDRLEEFAAASSSSVDGSIMQVHGDNEIRSRGGGDQGRGGRGGGRRALRPEKSHAEQADYVITRPKIGNEWAGVKKAVSEPRVPLTGVALVANYFPLISRQSWSIFHYHVDFEPEVERTGDKRAMFRDHRQSLDSRFGWTLFDGMALYTVRKIPPEV